MCFIFWHRAGDKELLGAFQFFSIKSTKVKYLCQIVKTFGQSCLDTYLSGAHSHKLGINKQRQTGQVACVCLSGACSDRSNQVCVWKRKAQLSMYACQGLAVSAEAKVSNRVYVWERRTLEGTRQNCLYSDPQPSKELPRLKEALVSRSQNLHYNVPLLKCYPYQPKQGERMLSVLAMFCCLRQT